MKKHSGDLKDWAEWLLFFSSYFPLYLIIAVKTRTTSYDLIIYQTPIFSIGGLQISSISLGLIVFGVTTFLFLYTVIWFKRAENGQPKQIKESDERNELIITYILVHVIPFAFINYAELLTFIAFWFLFLSIGAIQVRSRYLYVNPVLAIMKYDLYEVDNEENSGQLLLAKNEDYPECDESVIAAAELSNNVYITTR